MHETLALQNGWAAMIYRMPEGVHLSHFKFLQNEFQEFFRLQKHFL